MDFLEGARLIRLEPEYSIKPFDCDDADLNEFVLNDSVLHATQLIAVTYILEKEEQTLAFFSVLNDKISYEDVIDKKDWKKIKGKLSQRKQYKSYPAVKIGRFGVDKQNQGQGLGRQLIDYIKTFFITGNRTGCKFITVDAYNESLEFYKKMGFKFLTEKDEKSDTRLMYYDLIELTNSRN